MRQAPSPKSSRPRLLKALRHSARPLTSPCPPSQRAPSSLPDLTPRRVHPATMRTVTLAASGCRAALARASCTSSQTILPKRYARRSQPVICWPGTAHTHRYTNRSFPTLRRTFTSLPTLRPSMTAHNPIFRSATNTLARLPSSTLETAGTAAAADIVPKTSISAHPAFLGLGAQIRCGPRPNLERSSRLVRKRRSGFLARQRSQTGRKILQRRRVKGRKNLSQ